METTTVKSTRPIWIRLLRVQRQAQELARKKARRSRRLGEEDDVLERLFVIWLTAQDFLELALGLIIHA